jgi:phosphoglucan,water dikinase
LTDTRENNFDEDLTYQLRFKHTYKMTGKARIRIGNQTSFSSADVLRPFAYAVANGFDAFEWFPDKKKDGMGWVEDDISHETRLFIRDTAAKKDIRLSVHVSLPTNPLNPDSAGRFIKAIAFAKDIGASLVNMHLHRDEGIAAYGETLIPLVEDLSHAGIRLSIENTPETGPDDFNDLFRYLHRVCPADTSPVGMCLDIGHANLYGSTRNDYLRFFDMLGPEVPIIHLHLHENYGDFDNHLTVFTGPSGKDPAGIQGLIRRLKKRGFSGCIIFEQWPQPENLLREARDRLMEIIGSTARPDETQTDDSVTMLVKATQRFRSWRKRLEWIQDVLISGQFYTLEHFVYVSIYLRFIGSGEVPCSEDGGHYRPSHHARISQKIYDHLSGLATPENILILRKIYPWLPSFNPAFLRAEPLTRIRDIAHRNDIPHELKTEIKNTLQNKLHRSAGPEDVAVSEALLKRIIAPGSDYSLSFVEEFRQFHRELREFFNARSLDEQLTALMDKGTTALVMDFLDAKNKTGGPEQLLDCFRLLTALRSHFIETSMDGNGSERQQFQMADIRLEDFSFIVLSRLINHYEAVAEGIPWDPVLQCLILMIENLRLGGFDAEECGAIEAELKAWAEGFDKQDSEQLLRLNASLDRCRRLAEVYCDKIMTLFPGRVERLGHALGVAEHAIKVFAEADIRSHPVFQLSKLVSLLLKNTRNLASLPAWDAVVPGKVSGLLTEAVRLDDLTGPFAKPVIVIAEKIDGDEDIPAGVTGIIVGHDIPHLSHLAVRARQGSVVFVVCEDADRFAEVKSMRGEMISMDVSAAGVSLGVDAKASDKEIPANRNRTQRIQSGAVCPIMSADRLITLGQVTPATGGGKANSSRILDEISCTKGAGFRTPPGGVIPFGVMELSLQSSPLLKEYDLLVSRINDLTGEHFSNSLRRLREIISTLHLPTGIISGIGHTFAPDVHLMVRSSANCEDRENLPAAGLYDSFANVHLSDVEAAVLRVWMSLWNKPAVRNRIISGIPHDRAHMAVLLQEMIVPEFSFILHTVNPVTLDADEIYVELAIGMGETLASAGAPGFPFRMIFHKRSGEVRVLSFSSFSKAAWPDTKRGIVHKTVDYSTVSLASDKLFRDRMAARIGMVGLFVEAAFGAPQDIEGLVSRDVIYLVQSRPQ